MKIPAICHDERLWWEQLGAYKLVHRMISGRKVAFVIERTRLGCVHACTVDDICRILALVPENDWPSLEMFVLRQSTKKEWLLSSSWGRLAYSAELGQPGRKSAYSGPAVFLEALDLSASWRWEKSLTAFDSAELKRLRSDGHEVEDQGKYFSVRGSLEAVRATQLYRTLLHEIGHWIDWLERVERPSRKSPALAVLLEEEYFSRPLQEREAFAHHYGDSLRERLVARCLIPFPRILDSEGLGRERLRVADFVQ